MNDPSLPTRPRVLFVDDERRILMSLNAMFRADYEVTTAEGGAAAIEALKSKTFDVIVSDQRMPAVSGVEVLRAALELQPQAIRLLLTGYSDLRAIVGSINDGEIFRFIEKPWINTELRSTLAAAAKAASVQQIIVPASTAANLTPQTLSAVGVLVLDDDAQTPATLRRVLNRDRDVYAAESIEAALSLLEQHRVGVIFTELVVGGETVTPLLVALRQHYPALVVVVMTSRPDAAQSMSLINHGQIFRLLLKPVSDSVLRGTVNIASRRYEILRQHPEQSQRVAAEIPPMLNAPEHAGVLGRIKKIFSGWM